EKNRRETRRGRVSEALAAPLHRCRPLLVVVACLAVLSFVQMGASALFGGEARAASTSDNLLAGLSPSSSQRVRRAHVLTDGRASRPGGYWKTTVTSQLDSLE